MVSQQVILVTGANTGLGFQVIRALSSSSQAYNILLGGRSFSKAEQAVKAITEEFPSSQSKLFPIQIDIEDDNSIEAAFKEVQTKFGRLDALVNNAGKQVSYLAKGGCKC
jgi:NAD(P)-dependent dehydrogenase (short-subunit alcohol dehydrogenase family)